MPTSILSSGFLATRLPMLTPVDIGVSSFLVGALVIAVIFRRILVLLITVCTFVIGSGIIHGLIIRKRGKVDKEESAKSAGQPEGEKDSSIQIPGLIMWFSYEELRVATRDFEEKLGQGGFGSVFKGTLQDGTLVAVKCLGEKRQNRKEAEVKSFASIHHFNIVKLIGCCREKPHHLVVYELVTNGSLDKWIFSGDPMHHLNWQIRKKIAIGTAKGLAYLHEEYSEKIVHLDVKPQNILLDENFNAKISDFGLAKLIERDKSQVFTTMTGTPGYIAPECRRKRITEKVDIYSFGIVLLEIVCRRRNFDSHLASCSHLLNLLQRKSKENKILDIVGNFDEDMKNNAEEVERMIRLAAWCLQDDHTRRPSMSTVVNVLEGVMEVDSNINFNFIYALTDRVIDIIDDASPAPQASVLSYPR